MTHDEEKQILFELRELFASSIGHDQPGLANSVVCARAEKYARHTIWRTRNDGFDPVTGDQIPLLPADSDPVRRIPSDDE